MQLSSQQLRQFVEEGYLFLPDCFSEAEVAMLRDEAEQIYATNRQEVWREKTGAPRTAFAAHTYNEAFRLLGHHPRLIRPVEQVFGEPLYMHQYKINAKAAFEGDVWQWHQDYGIWARDDGMPEPRAMNIAVFMDEVMPINGPLILVPKSHKHGVLAAGHDEATTSYPLWVYGMHPVPAFGTLKPGGYTEQYSGAELIRHTIPTAGLPHSFLSNVQNFQAEAALWVTMVLMSGFFERHPKINAAVFEASSTWLSFLIDECDKAYRLYKNERQLPPLKCLPSETFAEHCMTGFEGDEAPPAPLPELYGDILYWSSDVYHHDGGDAWRAIETMQKYGLPVEHQAKFLGSNARRLYKVHAPRNIIRDRVTEIERPDWWPTEEEIRASLKPAAVTRG